MKKIVGISLLILSFVSIGKATFAQSSVLESTEDSLVQMVDSIYKSPIPEMRAEVNIRFVKMLVRALKEPNSFDYPFTKLQTKIHIIYPDDKSFRIFDWVLPYSDFGRKYYGAIQKPSKDSLVLYPLNDVSDKHRADGEDIVFQKGQWYGAEYYNIKTVTNNDGTTYYTLLGYNNDGIYSSRKIVDILTFDSNGIPLWGAPIFALPNARDNNDFKKRFILEYKKDAQASLNISSNGNILFDHLQSEVNNPNLKTSYVPTGQTDGLEWQNGIWRFVQNIIQPMNLKDGQAPIDGVMGGSK